MPTKFKFESDVHAAFAAEAMLLRATHAYRTARERAKDDARDVSHHVAHLLAGPEVPSYDDLEHRYDDLLDEFIHKQPDSPHGALGYVELVLQIIADEITTKYREEGGIASSEHDLRYALELLVNVRNWSMARI